MIKTTLFLLLLTITPLQVFAWGPVGHSTIGMIAQAHLTPQAQAGVQKLLGADSLAAIANWADQMRGQGKYPQTVWYHFEKIPDNTAYLQNLKAMPDWQLKKGGVVAAILVANQILRDHTAPLSEQTDALKFLVHFVGDLHQPLHTGAPADNGGDKISVTWMGSAITLHSVWDSGMLYTGHADILNSTEPSMDAATAYSAFLMKNPPLWFLTTNMDVEGWLNESMQIRPAAYNTIYNTNQPLYQQMHLPEVDRRIYAAGLRLAAILNDIFAGTPTPDLELQLRKNVETVMGSLDSAISLRP